MKKKTDGIELVKLTEEDIQTIKNEKEDKIKAEEILKEANRKNLTHRNKSLISLIITIILLMSAIVVTGLSYKNIISSPIATLIIFIFVVISIVVTKISNKRK